MKLPRIKPWRSSLTPGNVWPFTSNIPPEVLDGKEIHSTMRTFPGDHDFVSSHKNNFPPYPSIDIQETKEGYTVDADLPGISEDEIELVLHDNT